MSESNPIEGLSNGTFIDERSLATDVEHVLFETISAHSQRIRDLEAALATERERRETAEKECDYHKEWREEWHRIATRIAMENQTIRDHTGNGNRLIIQSASGPPMTPLSEQVCIVCGAEAKGTQNVGSLTGTSECWEWRCEAHQIVTMTVENARKLAEDRLALAAERQRADRAESALKSERELTAEMMKRLNASADAELETHVRSGALAIAIERADHAEAAAAALREAIESDWFDCPIKGCGKPVRAVVETFYDSEGYSTHSELAFDCPNCEHGDDINDDMPDYWGLCAARSERKRLAKKLSTDAGTALLERLRTMEAALSEIDAINLTYETAGLERAHEMQGIARAALGTERT